MAGENADKDAMSPGLIGLMGVLLHQLLQSDKP
jgi:hypothetical protein